MSKRNPGYYTPQQGKDPEKIHRALSVINSQNGGIGATIAEIAKRSRVLKKKVHKEMRWGKKGNAGFQVIKQLPSGAFIHTDRYDPDQVMTLERQSTPK